MASPIAIDSRYFFNEHYYSKIEFIIGIHQYLFTLQGNNRVYENLNPSVPGGGVGERGGGYGIVSFNSYKRAAERSKG